MTVHVENISSYVQSGTLTQAAITAWTSITSPSTRMRREQLADEISAITDDQLRANLQKAMSGLFRSLESDLERNCVRVKR
jgi:hypothetical protein